MKNIYFPPLPEVLMSVLRDPEEGEEGGYFSIHPFTEDSLACTMLFDQHRITMQPFTPKVVTRANGLPIRFFHSGVQCHINPEHAEFLQNENQLVKIQAWTVVWRPGYGDCLHLIVTPHIDTLVIEANTIVSSFNIILNQKVTAHWDPYIPDGLSNIQSFRKFILDLISMEETEYYKTFGYHHNQVEIERKFRQKAQEFAQHLRNL